MKDRKTAVETFLDREVDRGWKAFVDDIRDKNRISNRRLIRVVAKVLGERMANDLLSLSMTIDEGAYLFIVSKPKGVEFNDSRWPSFPIIWADYRSGEYRSQTLYVKLREKKFIKVHYD